MSSDDGWDGESNSIQNQKKLLQKAAKEYGFSRTKFFVDDGISATTFNRSGFQEMIQGVEQGIVGTIIRVVAFTVKAVENRYEAAANPPAISAGGLGYDACISCFVQHYHSDMQMPSY